ncbi:LexA repressor [Helicobacter muridarum]|uniref:LexA repressor n=3 Tax=Helicobacter muridarum TaxID=216 RepID=A0A377PSE5_9HELI|nr:LexA repressor [Helicobacter muridarum]STQ86394.1 LexA repressor [Helicobacter muridarum]
MTPTIPPNCRLLVQKGMPREEQICVTRIDDELYIKRLQKLPKYKLISDNKSYDDIDLEGRDYDILGIVVGLFQKMT